jgi:hypothetical protein
MQRLVSLLVRAEYVPYGVSGWTALAEVVAEDQSDGFRKKGNQGGSIGLSIKREKARNGLRMSVLLNECIRSCTGSRGTSLLIIEASPQVFDRVIIVPDGYGGARILQAERRG